MPSLPNHRGRSRVAPVFNVADMGGGEVELTLYGEVTEEDSRDWVTGERDGLPLVSTESINERYPELAAASHVTVRLNSCGGDAFAGVAIHNVLKSIAADVTVRIEGIAASAASAIACAGDEVIAMPGSIFMVHEAAAPLLGYYSIADLDLVAKELDGCNRSLRNVYAAKTGKTDGELAALMSEETWLVGQEIVDAGFADRLESDPDADPDEVEEEGDGEVAIAGVLHDFRAYRNVPSDLAARVAASVRSAATLRGAHFGGAATARAAHPADTQEPPVEAPAPAVADMTEPPQAAEQRGETPMDVTELRAQYPGLVADIESAASEAERARIAAIDEIAAGIPADMVADAKYTNPVSAETLAFNAMKADRAAAAAYVADALSDAGESGAAAVAAAPAAPEDGASAEDRAAAEAMANAVGIVNQMMKKGGR